MARLITRDGSNRTKPVEVLSRADLDVVGLGKKWSVSLDGGLTFQPYREVRDADWAAFFAPSPGSSDASPSAARGLVGVCDDGRGGARDPERGRGVARSPRA